MIANARVSTPVKRQRAIADLFGVVTAAACAVHCLALPVLIASTPLLVPTLFQKPWVEWAFVALSCAIGVISFRNAFHDGHSRRSVLLFIAGLTVLLLVRTLVGDASEWLERVGLLLGASLIISAHVRHAREVRHVCAVVLSDRPTVG
jgi:hypothetical protein